MARRRIAGVAVFAHLVELILDFQQRPERGLAVGLAQIPEMSPQRRIAAVLRDAESCRLDQESGAAQAVKAGQARGHGSLRSGCSEL
ncbi:hypothetical protein XM52_08380 [Roseovarius indicus]|uniref:Uncharacterized protein n=1 Tax=Roseovarius indicus TaxID=540747 RepID=A0A0T5PAS7_9RHOB|nr:hypothetical protein XM52_08380 [Roseovarius indicus]